MPEIAHVKETQEDKLTSESVVKKITADQPEQRKVERRKVSEVFKQQIESEGAKKLFAKFLKQPGEMDL